MTKKDMEAGECSKCGGNRFNGRYECTDCVNKRRREKNAEIVEVYKINPKDEICNKCGSNNWDDLGRCRECTNNNARIRLLRDDRICPTSDCNQICLPKQHYCVDCISEIFYKRTHKPNRKCTTIGCEKICDDGYLYCYNCVRKKAHDILYCNNPTCRLCGSPRSKGVYYCSSCNKKEQREFLEREDRVCGGYDMEYCGNICPKLAPYCTDCMSAKDAKRRSKRKNAEGHHTSKQSKALLELFSNLCLECFVTNNIKNKEDIQVDHVQALHNGGSNGLYNLQPLCAYHNISKKATNVRYIEEALDILEIPVDDYLDVVDLSDDDYSYILDWWSGLGEKEYREFDW